MSSDYDYPCEACGDEPQCETPLGRIAEIGGLAKPARPRLSENSLKDFFKVIKDEYLPTFRWTETTKRYGQGSQVNMTYCFRDEWKDIQLGEYTSFLENDLWKTREEFYYRVFNYVLELIFDLRGKFEEQRKVH